MCQPAPFGMIRQKQARSLLAIGSTGVVATVLLACNPNPPSTDTTADLTQAIVGGTVDSATRGVVSLNLDSTGHYFAADCSGTLIAPNLVLTARHCVSYTVDPFDAPVSCTGTRFIRDRTPDTILISPATDAPEKGDPSLYSVKTIFAPDEGDSICGFDLALLELSEPIPAGDATPLIPRLTSPVTKAEHFSAIGFGLTEDGGGGHRMRSDANAVTCIPGECSRLDGNIADSEWLSEAAPLCHGDSGAPALDGENRVIGVASRGAANCSSVVFSAVSSWSAFISRVAANAATSGSYPTPSWVIELPEAGAGDAGTDRDAGSLETQDASATHTEGSSGGCAIDGVGARSGASRLRILLLALGFCSLARRRSKPRTTN